MGISKMQNKLFAGLDLGGSFLKFGIGNKDQGIIDHDKIAVINPNNENAVLDTISLAINIILNSHSDISEFAMGSPGTVNTIKGIVTGVTPNIPCLTRINLKQEIEMRHNISIHIENDANIMALAEKTFYPDKSLLGITVGTGIGSGFVNENGIFRGDFFSALELGHTIVENNGRNCKCGKQGCVESYSSAPSIIDQCNQRFPDLKDKSIGELYKIADSNQILNDYLNSRQSYLAIGIANAIMILNPSVVVIGGGVVDIPQYDFNFMKSSILHHLQGQYRNTIIEKAKFGNQAGIFGAICLAESFFLE